MDSTTEYLYPIMALQEILYIISPIDMRVSQGISGYLDVDITLTLFNLEAKTENS